MNDKLTATEMDEVVNLCVNRIETGQATVEDCLSAYPHLAAELEPVLRIAQSLFATRLPAMNPLASQAIQERVLLHASKLEREARQSGAHSLLRGIVQRMALALALIVLLVGVEGGLWIASADSLPGEPLYLVKRASEHVQLAFTQDAAARAGLHIFFAQRRLNEAVRQRQQRGTWNESTLHEMTTNLQSAAHELERDGLVAAQNDWERIAQISQSAEKLVAEAGEIPPSMGQTVQDLRRVREKAMRATGKSPEATPALGPQLTPSFGPSKPTPQKATPTPGPTVQSTKTPRQRPQEERSGLDANATSQTGTDANGGGIRADASPPGRADDAGSSKGKQPDQAKGQQTSAARDVTPTSEPTPEPTTPASDETGEVGQNEQGGGQPQSETQGPENARPDNQGRQGEAAGGKSSSSGGGGSSGGSKGR